MMPKMPKKMSSFELNFIEKNTSKNIENMPLTNQNDLDNKNLSKNKTSTNIRMSTLDSNSNIAINNTVDPFNSPGNLDKSRQNYAQTYHNNRSSMQIYNLKLSRSKLKAVTRTSALLSGFAMVAMVELGLDYSDYFEAYKQQNQKQLATLFTNNSTNQTIQLTTIQNQIDMQKYLVPDSVLVFYSLVTCLLVGVHMLALMISTCILPQLEASSYEQMEFEQQLYKHEYNFLNHTFNMNTNLINSSDSKKVPMDDTLFRKKNDLNMNETLIIFPYQKFHKFIETAWISSTVIGIFLFLVEIGLVVYIKFFPISHLAALTGAIVMTPISILFIVFTVVFYKRLADFKISTSKIIVSQLEKNSIHVI